MVKGSGRDTKHLRRHDFAPAAGYQSVWTAISVFALGLLTGWGIFDSEAIRPTLPLGSLADLIAAVAAVVAACSTIAIAYIGHRAIRSRDAQSLRLAKAMIRSAVVADMEMAVRLSRRWERQDPDLKVEWILRNARELNLHRLSVEGRDMSSLPVQVLTSFYAARSLLPILTSSVDRTESDDQKVSVRYVVFVLEQFADNLQVTADYLFDVSGGTKAPWAGWSPFIEGDYYRRGIASLHR